MFATRNEYEFNTKLDKVKKLFFSIENAIKLCNML